MRYEFINLRSENAEMLEDGIARYTKEGWVMNNGVKECHLDEDTYYTCQLRRVVKK